jgi:tetratricopeptide (TPR) repeat protein
MTEPLWKNDEYSHWEFRLKQRAHQRRSPSITPRRRRLFSIIVLFIPILFFVLLEFSLRLFHYGPDLSLFTTATVGGKSYYTMNPSVKNRYFSRFNFNPITSPESFAVSKPPGTFRIFCLGGSTTIGYPYWYNGAFSSFLRDRLRAVFPDRSIEIVNVGMTATNSYTVLDLSEDLTKYDPDLLIVYDGHNEFYGALGVASNEYGAPTRWMTLLRLRMVHLRTFQLAEKIFSELLSMVGKTPIDYSRRVTMMEQVARGRNVPYGGDAYVQGLTTFRQNLKGLIDRCMHRDIPLFLSTQVSNIRDQFPFVPNNAHGISQQQRSQFQQLHASGLELQSRGLTDSAIILFRTAITLDSLHADAHYRLAQCLDAKGRKREAYDEYILARDYDELRFRTDSKFNNLIRSMEDHEHCFVADIEAVFKSLSRDSLIGRDLIIDHLHPNTRGHFLIAKEYARLMRNRGLLASSAEWSTRDTVSDDSLWDHRHLTDVDELTAARITEILTSAWPFKNPSSVIAPVLQTDTLRFLAEQVAHDRIGWKTAHMRAAEYYLQRGDSTHAEKEYTTIINQLPADVGAYLRLARLYFDQKRLSEAETVLLTSLQIEQTAAAYRSLGDIHLKQGKAENAVRYYEELRRFPVNPADAPENAYVLALAYLLSERPDQATHILEQTVAQYPGYRPAQELLTRVRLAEKGNPGK